MAILYRYRYCNLIVPTSIHVVMSECGKWAKRRIIIIHATFCHSKHVMYNDHQIWAMSTIYATPFNFFGLADRPDVINNKSLHCTQYHAIWYPPAAYTVPSVYCGFKYNARLSILDNIEAAGNMIEQIFIRISTICMLIKIILNRSQYT